MIRNVFKVIVYQIKNIKAKLKQEVTLLYVLLLLFFIFLIASSLTITMYVKIYL